MPPAQTAPSRPKQPIFGRRGWLVRVQQWRSVPLLVSLLTLLAVGPGLNEHLTGLAVWELFFTLVVLSGIYRLSVRRRPAFYAALLALPAMACLWLRQFVPAVGLSQAGLGVLTLFLLYTGATLLLYVFREERVTMDTLSGAFCVYLLMGLAWGSIYSLVYLQAPGAFHLPDAALPRHAAGITADVPFNLLVYYSFMTLTTVGYGDVLPLTAAAHSAAIIEAVLGHFYLAILVARLVGLHIAGRQKGS